MSDEITQSPKREPALTYNLQIGTREPTSKQSNLDLENNSNYVTTDSKDIEIKAEFFKVEVYTDRDLSEQEIANFNNLFVAHINHLIKKLNEDIKLTAGIVEKICLVGETLLGEVIFQVQGEKGLNPEYTGQKDYYHTAAKTISYLNEKGETASTIVINLDLYGAIMLAFAENKPYDEWNIPQQFVYYILAHECGHALDSVAKRKLSLIQI